PRHPLAAARRLGQPPPRRTMTAATAVQPGGSPMQSRVRCGGLMIALATVLASVLPAGGIEIEGVGNGALDQPRVNMIIRTTPEGDPLTAPGLGELEDLFDFLDLDPALFGYSPSNIEAFYDTGAGVGLFGGYTAQSFGLPMEGGVQFSDV